MEFVTLGIGDIVVIVVYFAIILAVGCWATWQANRGTMKGYFLAGKNIAWWPVGASLFASNIGSVHFIGLAGTGAASGLAVGAFEFNAMFVLVLLGWVFVPVYISSGVYTMPEYLRKRFGGQRVRVYLSVVALFLSIFTKISADLFSGALFIQQALRWNIYISILILLGITGFYTLAGGLSAVIWTDAAQTFVMLVGAFILMILAFLRLPYEELKETYFDALPNSTLYGNTSDPLYACGLPRDDAFHIFRDPVTSDLPWPGMVFGITVSAVWYWCTDQVIVQRTLAARNLAHAKGGCIFAGYLKIFPMFVIVLPGMISRVLYPDEVACADPDVCLDVCGSSIGCSNIAYPKLVLGLLPDGLRGLMMAVMMSALISSLTSIFNSSSTIFTVDIWQRIRKNASESELMFVGRIFVLVLIGISILWIPVIQAAQGGRLFDYVQSVTSYLAPPICAVFVLAVAWPRINEQGAFWGLMVGLVIGLIRLILDIAVYPAPACGSVDNRPSIIKDVHYLYFGLLLFGIVFIFTIIVSFFTKKPDEKHLARLTFPTRFAKEEIPDIKMEENVKAVDPDKINLEEKKGQGETGASSTEEKESIGKKCFNWICGVSQHKHQLSQEEQNAINLKMTDISETKKERIVLNVNAILLIVVSIVFWIYFR